MNFSFSWGVDRHVTADTVHAQPSRFCIQRHFTALMVFPPRWDGGSRKRCQNLFPHFSNTPHLQCTAGYLHPDLLRVPPDFLFLKALSQPPFTCLFSTSFWFNVSINSKMHSPLLNYTHGHKIWARRQERLHLTNVEVVAFMHWRGFK